MMLNLLAMRSPTLRTELMMTIAIKAAIRPYSIAVAAVSSLRKQRTSERAVFTIPLDSAGGANVYLMRPEKIKPPQVVKWNLYRSWHGELRRLLGQNSGLA